MKKKLLIFAIIIIAATATVGAIKTSKKMQDKFDGTKVLLHTSLGDITLGLYNDTPLHRDNFIANVKNGVYNGTLFHRVIKDFMIQGGDVDSKDAPKGKMLGSGDIGHTVEAEFVYPKHFHKRGALAAARTGDAVNPEKRSSGSQFYIVTGKVFSQEQLEAMANQKAYRKKQDLFQKNTAPYRKEIMKMQIARDTAGVEALRQKIIEITEAEYAKNPEGFTPEQIEIYSTIGGTPHLDGEYTVYGEVLSGMDVVEKIEGETTDRNDRPENDIKIISAKIIK